ncbi:dihydrodipicolinate synthase family protein [Mixta intestinalis]|uniref:4-hydroxy-tetrahydrodipicolinate synthase n=1 Tax=Mixta intestinalis TaxID=1615494 RepID=A0A6P1PUR0_9GAMM|nr:dihydrodipicolinate synthase family protein [Mixta intestinalis]QHM70210.1 4-hydroxy-tetrahydrodipicolinate synthase [Mixta intestinalis]
MFKGLSAFPLTPITSAGIDRQGFIKILERLTAAEVDSVGILGSTGSYAYLTREQRKHVAAVAKQHTGDIPMMICVGAISTEQVLYLAEDAQQLGASALLLPPLSYQRLNDDEVFCLFETVTQRASVPVCVYDNPGTTHFMFSDELHGHIAALRGVKSIKIPGVPSQPEAALARVRNLRGKIPHDVTIGISGDDSAATGLNAGCEVWYSVCGGLFPEVAKEITQAAAAKDSQKVMECSARLEPLWALFRKHGGSIRVIAAAAGIIGLTNTDCLPRPLLPLSADNIAEIAGVLKQLALN